MPVPPPIHEANSLLMGLISWLVVGAIAAMLLVGPVFAGAAAGCAVFVRRVKSVTAQRRAW